MTSSESTPKRPNRWPRRISIALAVVLLAWVLLPMLFAPVLRGRLQAMVSQQLDAELRTGWVWYLPPYGLDMRNARLVTRGPGGEELELLRIERLQLKLAEWPSARGPLIIEKLLLHRPAVRLIRTSEGLVGRRLLKDPSKADASAAPRKLSAMFRLRQIAMVGGSVVYEDRARPGSVPLAWNDLRADLRTAPRTGGRYEYQLVGRGGKLADLDAAGTLDLDSLVLEIWRLGLSANPAPGADESALPPAITQWLESYQVQGALSVDAVGSVPLRDLSAATGAATVQLKDGSARIARWDLPLDQMSFSVQCRRDADAPLQIALDHLEAASADNTLRVQQGVFNFDRTNDSWKLSKLEGHVELGRDPWSDGPAEASVLRRLALRGRVDFTATAKEGGAYELLAYPRDLQVRPPRFPLVFDSIAGGPIRVAQGTLILENLVARYGDDRLLLKTARLPMNELPHRAPVSEISGIVDFAEGKLQYPPALQPVFERLRPVGPFFISGEYTIARQNRDYRLMISSDHGALVVTDKRIVLSDVRGDALVVPQGTDVRRFQCTVLDGTLTGSARITHEQPPRYEAKATLRSIDLEKLSKVYILPESEKSKLSGRGFAAAQLAGSGSMLDQFGAQGEFELIEGQFWEFPVLQGIVSQSKVGKDALTAGQAAGLFEVSQRKVTLKQAAVSAPALGLNGSGEIDFDGKLNLSVIAAPLADWRDKLKQTNVPLISNVAGELAGGVQKLLDSATSTLLYEFRVTGTFSQPQITTVPAPALSNAAAALFGRMLGQSKDQRIIEWLRGGRNVTTGPTEGTEKVVED